MSKYDIYGIGGALVDTEVKVSDKFLADSKIEKGVMTLVDEVRQRELLNAICSKNIHLVKKCGGSVCNSIVAASSLGSRTFFSGKVASDADGDLYINDLKQAGVDFHSAGQDSGITGKCLVMVTEDAERTMNTFLGVSDTLSSKEIDRYSLKNSEWFYVEGYLATHEKRTLIIKETVEFAKKNGVKIAISLSDRFVIEVFGDAIRNLMGDIVDLIFCNKDEALAFTGTNDLNSAIQKLKRVTKTFVITDGANGAITYDGDVLLKSKGFSVRAIDTNGAGDMFAGAFLNAITSGKNYNWAAKLANYCAASVVSQYGPRLSSQAFFEIKQKFGI